MVNLAESSTRMKTTVWITASQAGALRLLSKTHRKEQEETLNEMLRRGIPKRDARIEVMGMRAEYWPHLEDVVASALGQRLAEPDMAGPWQPLTETEGAAMRLSGRWPGPDIGALVQRNYALPSDLAEQLRTVSWRMSAEPLDELRRREAFGRGTDPRTEAQLIAALHSPGRIVRQALGRYGPTASPGTRDPEGS